MHQIAVLQPADELRLPESLTFDDFESTVLSSLNELLAVLASGATHWHCILVPELTRAGETGPDICAHIRQQGVLDPVLVAAWMPSRDLEIEKRFFQAGADICISAPYSSDALQAAIRLKRTSSHTSAAVPATYLSESMLQALDSLGQGFVLFDAQGSLIFINRALTGLMGIEPGTLQSSRGFVEQAFQDAIQIHRTGEHLDPEAIESALVVSDFDRVLPRIDGRSISTSLVAVTLTEDGKHATGYAFSVHDRSSLHQLERTLTQARRTQSLCLLSCAACVLSLHSGQTALISPLSPIEQALKKAPKRSSVGIVLTILLEFLDLVVDPGVEFKLQDKASSLLAVSEPDLFQLLGHMILYAVEQAGAGGTVYIETGENTPGYGLPVIITSKMYSARTSQKRDTISLLLRGPVSGGATQDAHKVSYGLTAAEQIAHRYRATIERREATTSEIALRVFLPVSGG